MIYGYARCSTNEDKQDINAQILKLKEAGLPILGSEFLVI